MSSFVGLKVSNDVDGGVMVVDKVDCNRRDDCGINDNVVVVW